MVAEYRMRTSLQILKNESVPYLPFFLSEAGGHINFALTDDVTGNTIQTMTAATKLLEAMRRNPLDWRIEQLQTVARQHGIDWRQKGSSHCVFIRSDGQTLPVPAHRPIKPVYVKKFVELVRGD